VVDPLGGMTNPPETFIAYFAVKLARNHHECPAFAGPPTWPETAKVATADEAGWAGRILKWRINPAMSKPPGPRA
jgi:hypothetical protein